MIKCPHCGKRVQGQDLVAGTCSFCNERLTSEGDSSLIGDSKQFFKQQVRDSSPSNRAGSDSDHFGDSSLLGEKSDLPNEDLGSAATFISDEFASQEIDDEAGMASSIVDSQSSIAESQLIDDDDNPGSELVEKSDGPEGGDRADATFASDNFGEESQDIAATYISAESPDDILKTDANLSEVIEENNLNTFVTEDGLDGPHKPDDVEMHLKTFVVETSRSDPNAGDADQTYISDDVPEGLLKTVESLWGSLEEAEPSQPATRPDPVDLPNPMRKQKSDQNPQQQTLVIKTKSFSDTISGKVVAPRLKGDEPEYELTKVLGEGGMGIVYDARQTSIDRNVAVKMLKAKSADNQKQRAKFLAEAVVTGELDHPNIVPIYDVGANADGALFYSMKKVQGTPWLKAIKQKTVPENLEILMKIADAVGFAHARGVVHRDLKPENVMLGEFGEVLVMDWGLAQPSKTFRKSRSITETNTMGGTPAYMAPEMTTGPIDRIGPASDVYLLGAMLFEILTGSPPHVAKNAMKCLMAAARNEIAPTDKKGELMDIAMRAMATNPEDRYQDVKSFQGAIRDYQSHSESVMLSEHAQDDLRKANGTQDYEHFSRAVFGFQQAIELWSGNKGAVSGLANAKLAYAESAYRKGDLDLSLSLLDQSNPNHTGLRAELLAAQQEREAKQKRLVVLRRLATGLAAAVFFIVFGASLWIRREQLIALDAADRATMEANRANNEAIRANDEATNAIKEKKRAEEAEGIAKDEAENARIAAKKEELAKIEATSARDEAILQERRAEYEAYISKIGLAASQIDKNAFNAARKVLEGCKPELRNWEWGRLDYLCNQRKKVTEAIDPVDAIAVDRMGKRFATGGWNGTARIWNRETGQMERELKHNCDYVHAVAFSPDGRFVATGSNEPNAFVQIWDSETGRRIQTVEGHKDAVLSITFSNNGNWLLTSSYDKSARLWNRETGESREFLGHSSWVWSASFSHDEKRIVTAGQDGTSIVHDVKGTQRTPPFTGHKGPVYSASFSPDDKSVVSSGYDRRILIWKPEEVQPYDFKRLANSTTEDQLTIIPPAKYRALEGHTDAVRTVRFSDKNEATPLLVSGGQDNTVRVWDFATGALMTTFRGHGGEVTAALFLPDGRTVMSASHDKSVGEWTVGSYEELRTLRGRSLDGHEDAVLAASYSRDQRHIVTASRDRSARTWNALTGDPELTLNEGHAYLASSAIFFPDGRRLITAAVDNTTRIWDVTTGGEISELNRTGRAAAIALSHNNRWIATGGDEKSAQLWEVSTSRRIRVFSDHFAEVSAVAFSNNDKMLATGDFKGRVRLWNVETGDLIAKLDGHTRKITAIAFLENGTRLATASTDKTVGQWDVATGKEIKSLILTHPDSVLTMEVIPGTQKVVTSCADSQLRVWDTSSAKVLRELVQPDDNFKGDVYSLSISDDGQRLIAANSNTNEVHLWDLAANREVRRPRKDGQLGPMIDLKRRGGLLWSIAFHPGTDDILTVGGSEARLWDMKTGREQMSFSQHRTVSSARYSPDGKWIATGSWDNSAKVWNAQTGLVVQKLEGGHTANVNSTVFSIDGTRLLSSSDDGTAKIWEIATGKVELTLTIHPDRVRAASFSPDGALIATACNDTIVRLWRASDGRFLKEFTGHKWGVACVEFSPDGKSLISGSDDNTARVWNIATGESIELSGHTASVMSVACSPDGLRILTGSQDQLAKLWDAKTGTEILTLSRHTEDVTSVSFSPDGLQILTGSRDGTAVIWLSNGWLNKPEIATGRRGLQPR